MLVYGSECCLCFVTHEATFVNISEFSDTSMPLSKAEKCLFLCFHVELRDVPTFPVQLHHDLYWNYEKQCSQFTGRNLGIRTSVKSCVSVQEACVRRRWLSCLILSKDLPHLLLLQLNRALGTSVFFPALLECIDLLLPSWVIIGRNRLTLKTQKD